MALGRLAQLSEPLKVYSHTDPSTIDVTGHFGYSLRVYLIGVTATPVPATPAIFRMANPMLNPHVKRRASLHKQPDLNQLQYRQQ
jgi:hypothetical protein